MGLQKVFVLLSTSLSRRSMIWLLPSHSPLSRQQDVYHVHSSCMSPVELTDEGTAGKRGEGKSQIIRRQESLVIYNTLIIPCGL
jgi:hypothetical protein